MLPGSAHGRPPRDGPLARGRAEKAAPEPPREADRPPPQTPEKRKKQPTQEVLDAAIKRSTSTLTAAARTAWTRRDKDALGRLKVVELKQLCECVGEDLVGQQGGPRRPPTDAGEPGSISGTEARRQARAARPHVQLRVAVRLRCGPRTVDDGGWRRRGYLQLPTSLCTKRVARWLMMAGRVWEATSRRATRLWW